MTVNSFYSLYNSHLLHYYAQLDLRFPAAALLVKRWATRHKICDPKSGTLNSYSLNLMLLFYCQVVCKPPLFPNLQQLYPQVFNLGRILPQYMRLFQQFPAIPGIFPSENRESVGEIFCGFFDFFANFDWANDFISVRDSRIGNRKELRSNTKHFRMFIEDPYDGETSARCVLKQENFDQIMNAFRCTSYGIVQARNALSCILVKYFLS